ncbi:methyl-accepting chemotaxis protein [Geobacter sp. AOG2]|uniref:methyl-accepting chemotaxis protein n=1 Tax=Geobacter sp. AOG2 TaxID=1566347 RepID=UPI001CC3F212|nr:methyl-accepting chemotaxis protein [Geobacter sp. AOG2]GFE62919.1 chemotaxis protein [Geobacter sp. AOG2]
MSFFSNLRLVTKFTLVGGVASALLIAAIVCYVVGMRMDSKLFDEYRNRYAAMNLQVEQLYAQGFQTEQATRNIIISPTDRKALDNFKKAVADYDDLFGKLSNLAGGTALAPQLKSARALWDEGIILKRQVIELATQGNIAEATALLKERETPKWREYKAASHTIAADLEKLSAEKIKEIDAARSKTLAVIVAILAAAALLVSAGMVLIARGLDRRLQGILGNLYDVAHGEGDLTSRVAVTSRDELGRMAELFNEAWDKLERISKEVMEQATCVEAYGGQLGIESERISRGSRLIALQSTAVATASEEMSATAGDIAHSCTVAAEAAASANQSAADSTAILMQSVNAMNSISGKVHEAARTVTALGSRSDQIGAIVGTIEDIADQTNLLALNAAIEAARAGEQGRGFAVVADEVRALAERTTRATKEIAEMIKNIQLETKQAVSIMEEGASEVEKGIAESARSREALDTILDRISSLTMQVSQIATAAEEQSATTGEIVGNIGAITCSVENFDRTTQHMNSKVEQLQSASEGLKKTAATFKVNESPLLILDTAKSDHVAFVNRIVKCIDNREKIQASSLPDHKNCRFGKWYFSTGQKLCGSSRSFRIMDEPHERIHRIAREAVELHNRGMSEEAERLLEQVEDISVEIVEHLENVKNESKVAYA